jgi:hypothetical protein
MSGLSTVMLDNNALSHAGLAAHVQGKTVYLPDAILVELFGGGVWERSISHCLAPLAAVAENVVGTVNMGTALRRELQSGEATSSILADAELNGWFRNVLIGCRDEPDRAVEYFRPAQPSAIAERHLRMSHVAGNRALSADIIRRLKRHFGEACLARLRNEPEQVGLAFASIDLRPESVKGLGRLPAGTGLACPHWDAEKMASTPCCWMRLMLADLCLGVRRSVLRDFDSQPDNRIFADYIDTEVVIMGSYADELFSNDGGALWLDTALRGCVRELFKY